MKEKDKERNEEKKGKKRQSNEDWLFISSGKLKQSWKTQKVLIRNKHVIAQKLRKIKIKKKAEKMLIRLKLILQA